MLLILLETVAKLAKEFMACAVGGYAGCVIEVQTEQGPAMKRGCVDGPVIDAYSVFI